MKTSKWSRVGTNSKVYKRFNFEAFCKYHKADEVDNENMLSLYNMGEVRGRWVERVLQDLLGDGDKITEANQNTQGWDIMMEGKRWEIKTTSSICAKSSAEFGTSYLQIGGLKSKKIAYGIMFLDLVNYRIFKIKTTDFFNPNIFSLIPQGDDLSFRWFVDYNENKFWKNGNCRSKLMSMNTKAIKKYEK